MGSRVNALGAVSVMLLVGIGVWAIAPAESSASIMCPPTKIEDLFPEETTTTTTAPPPTTTAPTTTVPPTTTVAPTTTLAPTTTSGPTTTTAAPTTAPPETTTAPTTGTTDSTVPSETTATTVNTTSTAAPATTSSTAASTTTVPATSTTTEPPCDTPFVYPMVFPILGSGDIGSPFGADRDGGRRRHMGNDIFAPHLQPVVAVADGTVSRIAGDTGISGYRVHIRHDDGWSTLYIHLNNDTAGTDDGNGVGIRPDLEEGDRVSAGEVIGWVGDSGNAENTIHHLHFELRDPSGESVDPKPSLEEAERLAEPFTGPFTDMTDETSALTVLLSRGVAVWCDDDPTRACPTDPLRADRLDRWMAAFGSESTTDCKDGCPGVTAAEIARRLAWQRLDRAYESWAGWLEEGVPDAAWGTPPPQPPPSPADLSVNDAHAALGGLRRCLAVPNDARFLTAAEAAETFVLYLGWTGVDYCPTSSANR